MTRAWPLLAGFFTLVVVLYYYFVKRALFAACRRLAGRLPVARRFRRSEVVGVLELTTAALSHAALVVVLLFATGLGHAGLGRWPMPWPLLPLGVAVGVGEFALACFVCRVIIDSSTALPARAGPGATRSPPAEMTGWLATARGGWLRHHLLTIETLPAPLAALPSAIQVSCEETIFRGVMIGSLRESGMLIALLCSSVLFTAMQIFFMISHRGAVFPVVGAAIMAVVHGMLFWYFPYLLPLVIAHVSFFLVAVV